MKSAAQNQGPDRLLRQELRSLTWTLREAERDLFLITLLHGCTNSQEARAESDRLGISLRGNWFSVISLSIEKVDDSIFSPQDASPGNLTKQAGFFIRNIAEELAEKYGFRALLGRFAGNFILLVNCEEVDETDKESDYLLRPYIQALLRACQSACGVRLSAIITPFHEGLSGIHISYRQIREMQDYLTLTDLRPEMLFHSALCIPFSPEMNTQSAQRLERAAKFRTCVQIGDYHSALDLLHEMIREELSPGSFTLQAMNARLYAIVDCFSYAVDHMRTSPAGGFMDVFDPMPNVLYVRSAQALLEKIDLIFGSYFQFIEEKNTHAAPLWLTRMTAFIDNHFRDPNMSTGMVADALGLNSAYAARVFKQYMGVSVLEYIHRLRLKEATTLMGTGKRLKDIALAVGYDNPGRMSRAFRRYAGCAPGEMNPDLWTQTP